MWQSRFGFSTPGSLLDARTDQQILDLLDGKPRLLSRGCLGDSYGWSCVLLCTPRLVCLCKLCMARHVKKFALCQRCENQSQYWENLEDQIDI